MKRKDLPLLNVNIHTEEKKDNDFFDVDSDGIPEGYLRVTQALSPFSNLHKIDPKVLENAADRGRRVHLYCEMHAKNLFVSDYDEDCKVYVEAFKLWYDHNVEKLVYSEKRINSARHMLSGAFDMMVILKGDTGPSLIDIKTPAASSLSWPLQLGAYRMLIREEMDVSIDRRIVLKLPKLGKPIAKVYEFTEHEKDENLYLKALDLYRYFNS